MNNSLNNQSFEKVRGIMNEQDLSDFLPLPGLTFNQSDVDVCKNSDSDFFFEQTKDGGYQLVKRPKSIGLVLNTDIDESDDILPLSQPIVFNKGKGQQSATCVCNQNNNEDTNPCFEMPVMM